MSISTAIDLDRVSAISGYEVNIDNTGVVAGNLPQRIDIFVEKASDKQTAPAYVDATTAYEVGLAYGFNSPAYATARILRPRSGSRLGSIPTVFWGIDQAVGSVAFAKEIVVTGTATKNATHRLLINGRTNMDGVPYSFTVVTDDTNEIIAQKMIDAVNAVLGCPVKGTVTTNTAKFTAGWKGETSNEVTVSVLVGDESAGITYTTGVVTAGAGESELATKLPLIGDAWTTFVLNGLGNTAGVLDSLEAFNGSIVAKTGRYLAPVWKPFFAVTGTTIDTKADLITEFGDRGTEMTNVIVSAPNSPSFTHEIAAQVIYNYVPIAQNTPAEDVFGKAGSNMLTDIVIPSDKIIGDFEDSDKRDQIVKAGFCTVKLTGDNYEIIDFVTTRNVPEQSQTEMDYRWVRDLMIMFNLKYADKYLEDIFIKGKIIVSDTSTATAPNTISPARVTSIWEAQYFPPLIARGLLNGFSNFRVARGTTNANRFEKAFVANITSIARVTSTTISINKNVTI